MTALRLALLPIAFYLSVDFADPHMPGAMSFEVNDCVEGTRVERPWASLEPLVVITTLTPRAPDGPTDGNARKPRIVAADLAKLGVIPARDPRHISPDPPSPADDH